MLMILAKILAHNLPCYGIVINLNPKDLEEEGEYSKI